ncbi:MAG: zonular occludens toxin domain-containing protein [Candidatus Pacearchaeota archaeon]
MPKKRTNQNSDPWKELKIFLISLIKIIGWALGLIVSIVKIIFTGILKILNGNSSPKKEKEHQVLINQKSKNTEDNFKFDNLKVTERIKGNYETFDNKLINDSLILLIFGKRGSGKSSLGFRILENIHSKTKRKSFVLGITQKLLPTWIKSVNEIEKVPEGGVILIDEGAIAFGARDSMSFKNKELSKLMAVARHKDITLIFVTQNTGLIDKNIIALTDTLLIKEGSLLQMEMERPEVKKFYEKSDKFIGKIPSNKKKYVYVMDNDFEGVFTYSLPSFWSENLSKNKA